MEAKTVTKECPNCITIKIPNMIQDQEFFEDLVLKTVLLAIVVIIAIIGVAIALFHYGF